MQFILVAVGSIGDVFPLFEVSRELVQRGHRVRVITNPWYESHVAKAGAELIAAGQREDQERMLAHPNLWHPNKGWPLWYQRGALPIMRQSYEFIRDNYESEDTVVGGSWAALGAIVANEKLGVPLVTIHLEPDKFRTLYESPVMPSHMMLYPGNPPWLKRIQYAVADWLVVDRVLEPVNQFRRELGLATTKHFLGDWNHSKSLSVGMFPEWWGPKQPDWPSSTHLAGFPIFPNPQSTELPAEVTEFLQQGEPPVVFSPGGVNRQASRFFEVAAQTCERLSLRGIFITGYPDQLPATLPTGVRHFQYVPFQPLLKHVRAVAHHAGIGTIALCLQAAVPQIAVPGLHINRDAATRLERLGVGRMILPGKLSTRSLSLALEQILTPTNVQQKCNAIALKMQGVDAISDVCNRMEAVGKAGK